MTGRSPSGRATHEPGLASRPGPSVSVPNAWRAGSFSIASPSQNGGQVAGWIYGPLAIDRRDNGWAITHLRTGFSAGGVEGDIAAACRLVEAMVETTDWDFSVAGEAVTRAPNVKRAEDISGVRRVGLAKVGAAQAIEARRAETLQDGSVVDESAVPTGCAQDKPTTPFKSEGNSI